MRVGRPRSGTTRQARCERAAAPVTVDEVGCAGRRTRWRARWRTPRGAVPGQDRGRTNTTADRSARGFPLAGGVRSRRVRGSGRSSGQADATLIAARLEDGTTGAGAHAGTEPVGLGTAAGVGLKGTLHDSLRTGSRQAVNGCVVRPLGATHDSDRARLRPKRDSRQHGDQTTSM
jgi:hypothetical protein